MIKHQKDGNCLATIFVGDINFDETTWKTMSSTDQYDEQVLSALCSYNFEQLLDCQLDAVLVKIQKLF